MQPRIEKIEEKKLIGKSVEMSLIDNKTFDLFSSFMPNKGKISNSISSDIFEVMIYETEHFINFNPNKVFTKWATLQVSDFNKIPENMHSLTIESGLYAVFTYKGLAKDFSTLMQYVFTEWLPKSKYTLDNRAHYNLLGNKYIKDSPESEEEVYIPIK